ncbi:uncharacterized protein LOC123212006 [Mangifera indica]|uniref:uncharacterized protein LOC123212006 n=1 Tax=Mangifera indica TaxID=29780 RepID=UPI001CFBEF3A|nr:uncharacterized protein LOC123212006 [Mangifera indica]
MDVMQENNCGAVLEDSPSDKLLSPESADVRDEYSEPELLPRVGYEFQVEIPSLVAESDCLFGTKNPADIPHTLLTGLPIPATWINDEVGYKHEPLEAHGDSIDISGCAKGTQNSSGRCRLKPKVEPKNEMDQKDNGKGYQLVPGSADDTWGEIDKASFVLGLYIFGKNLVQVKKFVGSKRMGEILSLYYGTFYRSEKYLKWSECRKIKSKRCVYGQRIFTGIRQQELLSRLQLHLSEESRNTLLEDSKALEEGKLSLEEYVFTLRDKVGLNALVEAVGIGKGKQDLTGMAMEPLKSNQVDNGRPEIPIGKEWSKLTSMEIIKFLTGGYRLSKARSSDVFWEAVWPRLLARGWHSEEPNNHGCASGSKHSLVFLIPGVKKFSRRKLVKGNHYFDSVSDVLNKVAGEPGLLELEIGDDKGDTSKEENGWANETVLNKVDFADQQRHCYLRPRTPNCKDVMKFTVVDTSLANGGTMKVRELRSLPVEMRNPTSSRSHTEDSGTETSEESTDESDSPDTMCPDREKQNGLKPTKIDIDESFNGLLRNASNAVDFDMDVSFDRILSNASNGTLSVCGPDLTNAPVVKFSDQKSSICNGTQPRNAIKAELSQRMKPSNNVRLAPATKKGRRLTACNRSETTGVTINGLVSPVFKQDEARCSDGYADSSESVTFQVDPSQENLASTGPLHKGGLITSGEGNLSNTISDVEHPYEEPPLRRVIDLNLPILPDGETDEYFIKEETKGQPDQTSRQPDDSSANLHTLEQQPNMINRRHSTRNRPLTTKALEALAFGFLNTKQKRRFGDAFPQETQLPSRRARSRGRVNENLGSAVANLQHDEETQDDLCSENNNIFASNLGLKVD